MEINQNNNSSDEDDDNNNNNNNNAIKTNRPSQWNCPEVNTTYDEYKLRTVTISLQPATNLSLIIKLKQVLITLPNINTFTVSFLPSFLPFSFTRRSHWLSRWLIIFLPSVRSSSAKDFCTRSNIGSTKSGLRWRTLNPFQSKMSSYNKRKIKSETESMRRHKISANTL